MSTSNLARSSKNQNQYQNIVPQLTKSIPQSLYPPPKIKPVFKSTVDPGTTQGVRCTDTYAVKNLHVDFGSPKS